MIVARIFCIVLAASVTFSSCGQIRQPYEKLIPEDASLVVVVQNPEHLLKSLNSFVGEIGLSALIGGDINSLLRNLLDLDLDQFSQAFDTAKPAAMYMDTSASGTEGPVFLLPSRDKSKAEVLAKKLFHGDQFIAEGPYDGYLVLRKSNNTMYPLSKSLREGTISQYADDGISFYVRLGAIADVTEKLRPLVGESQDKAAKDFLKSTSNKLGSLGWLGLNITANKDVFLLKGFVDYGSDTLEDRGKLVASSPAKASRLRVENMVDWVYDSPNKRTTEFLETLITIADSAGTLRGNGYGSINLSISEEADSEIELSLIGVQSAGGDPKESLAMTQEGLKFFVDYVAAKDPKRGFGSIVAYKELGTETVHGLPAKSYQFFTTKPGPVMKPRYQNIEESLRAHFANNGEQTVLTLGKNSKDLMDRVLRSQIVGTELGTTKDSRELLFYLDDNPQLIAHVNLNKILGLADSSIKLNEDLPGLVISCAQTTSAKTSFTLAIDTKNLKTAFALWLKDSIVDL